MEKRFRIWQYRDQEITLTEALKLAGGRELLVYDPMGLYSRKSYWWIIDSTLRGLGIRQRIQYAAYCDNLRHLISFAETLRPKAVSSSAEGDGVRFSQTQS